MEKPVAMTVQSPGRKQIITIKPKIKRKVTELRCAEVRWFHRRKDDAKWTAFKGLIFNKNQKKIQKFKKIQKNKNP